MTKGSAALGVAGLAAVLTGLAYVALGTGKVGPAAQVPAPPASVPSTHSQPAPPSVPSPSRAVAVVKPPPSPQSPVPSEPASPRPSPEVAGPPPPIAPATTFSPTTPAPAIQSLPAPPPVATAIGIKKDAVIGVRIDQAIATDRSKVDDKITARVARDVVVDGRTAIPAGARLEGVVTLVERGGPSVDRGRIGVRFHTLLLGNNQRMSIQTNTIFRESEPNEPVATGARAAVDAAVSGAVRKTTAPVVRPTTAAVTTGNQKDARIPAGSLLTVTLVAELVIDSGSGR